MKLLNQIIIIEIIFVIGWFCGKKKILTSEACRSLSSLLVNIVNPVLIVTSFQIEYTSDKSRELLIVFGLSAAAFAVMILLSHVFIRRSENKVIERLASVYSNCGFVGIPIAYSLFGNEGVFFLSVYVAVFNIYFWTHGISTVEHAKKKFDLSMMLKSPAIIAIAIGMFLFFTGITIPDPFSGAMKMIAQVNTPLAMIVCGASIAETNFFDAFRQKSVYIVALFRLIVMPLIVLAVLYFIPAPMIIKSAVVVGAACPVAATCNIVTVKSGGNYTLTSQYFAVTTLLCPITMYLFALLTTNLYV